MTKNIDFSFIASKALKCYLIGPSRLEFLNSSDNVTFRVETEISQEKYLLKIHHSFEQCKQKAIIESELQWLEALSLETNLTVPRPMRNQEGGLVTEISVPNQECLFITLLRWVDGEVLNRQPTGEEAAELGQLLARLHNHTYQWKIPDNFIRPSYDLEGLQDCFTKLNLLVELDIMNKEDYLVWEETVQTISKKTSAIPITIETWGLIHSDIHECNYVNHRGELRPIDFSSCGFGYYVFDLAETSLHLTPVNRQFLRNGYTAIRPMSDRYEQEWESFFLWGLLRNYAFHSNNPNEYKWLSGHIPKGVNAYCRKFLEGTAFVF